MNKNIYVYNMKQANFYLSKGVMPVGCGVNSVTDRAYIVFDKESCYEAFLEWIDRAR